MSGQADRTLDALRAEGRRVTTARRLVVELLARATEHLTADDLATRIHHAHPEIHLSTVYRTLEVFEELGIIRHVHDGSGAARYQRQSEEVHLHLVCHRCGHRIDVEETSIADSLKAAIARLYDFTADFTHFAIAGRCAGCKAAEAT